MPVRYGLRLRYSVEGTVDLDHIEVTGKEAQFVRGVFGFGRRHGADADVGVAFHWSAPLRGLPRMMGCTDV